MTLVVAWVRKAGPSRELVVASDSRLTSVGHVDICQKIFPLARGDSFFAFCGDTILAFPIIFQLHSAIENYRKAADRTEDVTMLIGRVLNLLNAYRNAWSDTVPAEVQESNQITKFLLGGWSWRYGKFYIYPIQFNRDNKKFTAYSHSKQLKSLDLPKGEVCFVIGNYTAEFRHRLRSVVRSRRLKSLDYEPLDILGEMLSEETFTDRRGEAKFYLKSDKHGAVGGAPQALKIYQHANSRPIAIRWPKGDAPNKTVTLFGRPLFDWENTLNPIYDLNSCTFHFPLGGVTNFAAGSDPVSQGLEMQHLTHPSSTPQ